MVHVDQQAEGLMCRLCGYDLTHCSSCGELCEELDDEDICRACLDEAEHERQLRSDYSRSVL
jgi:hypothetical protein